MWVIVARVKDGICQGERAAKRFAWGTDQVRDADQEKGNFLRSSSELRLGRRHAPQLISSLDYLHHFSLGSGRLAAKRARIIRTGYITARWDLVTRLYELAIFAWDKGVITRSLKAFLALSIFFVVLIIPIERIAARETSSSSSRSFGT
ncbi:hypothetical protein KCV05_g178, partial [Aureobasidium melanogenum]